MADDNQPGLDEIIVRRRTVDQDVNVTETEVRLSGDDLGQNLSDFQSSVRDRMHDVDVNGTAEDTDEDDTDATDDAISKMMDEVNGDDDDDDAGESDGEAGSDDTSATPGGPLVDTEDYEDGDEDEGADADDDTPITAEEAAELWPTTSRNDFNSGCLSAEPAPQLGMGDCSTLWTEIKEKGLVEAQPPDDQGDADAAGEADGDDGTFGGELAEGVDTDIDPEDVQAAYLVIEGGTDTGEEARAQFEDYIDAGTLQVAEYFNSPVAKDIRDALDVELESPELVLETEAGYHVV